MTKGSLINHLSPAARISAWYLVIGIVWILFSDRFAHFLFPQPTMNEVVQTLKGWLFVLVTSLFLFALCRKYIAEIENHLEEAQTSNRSLKLLSQWNQTLVREREEQELYNKICRLLADEGEYPFAWIGMSVQEADSMVSVTPVAAANQKKDSSLSSGFPHPVIKRTMEVVRNCLRTGKPEVVLNIPPIPSDSDDSEVDQGSIIHSFIVLPLFYEKQTIGALTVCSNEASTFKDRERDLLVELANDLSYGIWALRSSVEREKALQSLKDAEKHFRLLVEGATGHAIFMLDSEGRILSWNTGAEKIYGYKQEEILGQSVSLFLPEDQQDGINAFRREMEVAFENGACQSEDWRLRKDGTRFWGDMVLSVIQDDAGQVKGYAMVTRDLTQQRLFEERILLLNQDLERRVAERTAEIMVANQELETFSYTVSHDLRAPLRAISGFAEILSRRHRENLNEEARHYLSNIIEASSRMNLLIDDLLSLARVGRQAIRHEPVDLAKITGDLVRETSSLAKEYGVTVHTSIDLDSQIVESDPSLLRQILLNLLTNAITYRRPDAEGGPLVWITAEGQGEDLLIEVKDNGIGIPKEYSEKIFKPFQRLHTHETYPGTGIGLAIVKKAVDLLSAKIRLDSIEGNGSSFYVCLPHCMKRS